MAVVYILVLVGSFIGIFVILSIRVLLRNRSVRKFVRSIRQRANISENYGAVMSMETPVQRTQKSPRTSAIEMQQVSTLVRQAEKAMAQGRLEETEKLFIQALTVSPEAFDVQAQLAKFYLDTDRYQKSEALYREILLRQDDITYHANLGLAYYKQSKFPEACGSYKEALARDPKSPERAAALARACIAAGHYLDAAVLLEKACERLSRDTELLGLLAECYEQLDAIDNAKEAYMRINKIEPYNEHVKERLSVLAKM
ncbi:MAG: tetratricopeptide repeat protein [bacterium]|nr:tetratricopeptide repeat protein [bacterium]